MANQRFYADPKTKRTETNGAISFGPGGPFDCLGNFAKIQNCPIHGADAIRLTVYATNYADTYFSVPACCTYKKKYISGYIGMDGETNAPVFRPYERHMPLFKGQK